MCNGMTPVPIARDRVPSPIWALKARRALPQARERSLTICIAVALTSRFI
jgi:hypothetical protein